jgi:hypothetical protein
MASFWAVNEPLNSSGESPPPDAAAPMPPVGTPDEASFIGDTLVGQAIRDSVRSGVPAAQIIEDYKKRGPQARADLSAQAPQAGAFVPVPKKAGFWARLFGKS